MLRRYEFENEEETTSLKNKKPKVSKGLEQPIKLSKDVAKDEKLKNTQKANSLESAITATSFDRVDTKLAKKKAKLKDELKALQKEVKKFVASASNKEPCKEVRVNEGRNAKESLPPDSRSNRVASKFERDMMEEEIIDKATTEFDRELHLEEDAELVARLSAPAKLEGNKKKKKKKSRHHLPRVEKERITEDARKIRAPW